MRKERKARKSWTRSQCSGAWITVGLRVRVWGLGFRDLGFRVDCCGAKIGVSRVTCIMFTPVQLVVSKKLTVVGYG